MDNKIFQSNEIAQVFKCWDKKNRIDVVDKINQYKCWTYRVWDQKALATIQWYLDTTSDDHVSQIITENGRTLLLQDVAKNYYRYYELLNENYTVFTKKIDCFLNYLDHDEVFPPLILGRARIKKQYCLLDGVHRSLALMAYGLKNPEKKIRFGVYIGYQWDFSAKISNLFSARAPNLPPVSNCFK